jgi:hypothetical protein
MRKNIFIEFFHFLKIILPIYFIKNNLNIETNKEI